MGLFSKNKGKEKDSGDFDSNDELHKMAKGMVELERLAKEHYLPQIDPKIEQMSASNKRAIMAAYDLQSDAEIRAVLLLSAIKQHFGNMNIVAGSCLCKSICGIDDLERQLHICSKV